MALTRRVYLQGVSALALSGLTSLAGCTGGRATPGEPEPNPTGPRPTPESGPYLPTEPSYDDWFDDVSTYHGTYDVRNETATEVAVGAKGPLGHFKFSPAAIAVSPGTSVTWVWTGEGGNHDVVALDGSFASPLTDRRGTTFAHTFDTPGVFKYYCAPHRGMGMKGAVVVFE